MKTATPTRLRDIKVSARDQLMLDPRNIAIEKGFNPRNFNLPENRAHLDEIKASIKENGTLQPLLVRWDAEAKQAVLVAGECRLRANLELIEEGVEIVAVPTIQVSGDNEPDRLLKALLENTGKPLSKWEIGKSFQRFIGFGWSVEQIAVKLGYSPRYVKESLELSDAPEDVKKLLSLQAVTPSLALQHIRRSGAAATAKLNEAVATARSRPSRNGKVTAKRQRKEKATRLRPDEMALVVKALKLAVKTGTENCADAAAAALDAIDAAMARSA